MKAVLSVAARCASTRLPRKVLAEVANRPILELIIERLRPIDAEIVIANNGMDPEIAALATRLGVRCVQAPVDVMAIHHRVMVEADADVLLLAGADDPLLDPRIFQLALDRIALGDVAYVRTAGWPLGLNVWAMTREAMEDANRLATAPDERQHVVPFWERRPRTYPQAVLHRAGEDLYGFARLTVDEPADLELIREICRRLPWDASAETVIELLTEHPELRTMNADGLQGTAARDAIYPDLRAVDDPLLADIRHHVEVSRQAALASIGDFGDFARGQEAAMLSMSQWLDYRVAR